MQLKDMIKLIYQNEFGGGHIISDEEKNLLRLKQEYEYIKTSNTRSIRRQLFESIGDGKTRLDIVCAIDSGCSYNTINRLHIESANDHKGSIDRYKKKMDEFHLMCKEKLLQFDVKEIKKFIDEYDFTMLTPIGHSDAYRQEYDPGYRIIKNAYARCFELFILIDELLAKKENVSVAIDGRCASGKSTLAFMIKNLYDCNVFHTDDYFLRPEQRTKERLAAAGGNLDYERFKEEIIEPVKGNTDFSYRPFDCEIMALSDEIKVKYKRLNIIEGAYCMHPEIGDVYDVKVFVDIKKEAQRKRIIKRNAAILHDRFFNEWVPMEEKYIEMMDIKSKCDIVFDSIKGFI